MPGGSGDCRVTRVPAGLVDAGCASLATFAVSLYAARVLDPSALGAYGLLFTGFVLVGVVPTQLLFQPAEVASLALTGQDRIGVLRRSMPLGAPVAVAAAGALGSMAWFLPGEVPSSTVTGLALTAAAASAVHPMQDHIRRLLHFGGSSWKSAGTSIAQLLATTIGLATLHLSVPAAWVPFGALAIANAVSGLVGWLAAKPPRLNGPDALSVRGLLRSGRWLLLAGIAPAAARFTADALIAQLAGASVLGYAHAARVVAQPVFVLGTGLQSVLGPRAMEAAAARTEEPARRVAALFVTVLLLASAAYLLLAGPVWAVNPMRWLVPNAYAVPWLAAATIVANAAFLASLSFEAELKGGRQERSLAVRKLVASALMVAGGATAAVTGAFARPLALGAWGVGRWIGLRDAARCHYPGEDARQATSEATATAPSSRGS